MKSKRMPPRLSRKRQARGRGREIDHNDIRECKQGRLLSEINGNGDAYHTPLY